MITKRLSGVLLIFAPFFLTGCLSTHHTVDANVSPIHVTLDVNLKVERELDNFFGDLDRQNPLLDDDEADENVDTPEKDTPDSISSSTTSPSSTES